MKGSNPSEYVLKEYFFYHKGHKVLTKEHKVKNYYSHLCVPL